MVFHPQSHIILFESQLPVPGILPPEEYVFFDIETTGFAPRSSHLYMIGAARTEGDRFVLRQWLLNHPAREQELLSEFSGFIHGPAVLVHFNGQTFDIPYLKKKYSSFRMEDPLEGKESIDIYRLFTPFKKLLCLPSLRQKTLEQYFGIRREDRYDGGELIEIYRKYVAGGSEELRSLLLLHNREDIANLFSLYRSRLLSDLAEGNYKIASVCLSDGFDNASPRGAAADTTAGSAGTAQQFLTIRLKCGSCFPRPAVFSGDCAALSVREDNAVLSVRGLQDCMKHYFPDCKNYYYLPDEDTAIHKSVGIYVDPSRRVKADRAHSYIKKQGIFYPQPSCLIRPDFRLGGPDGDLYFELPPSWQEQGAEAVQDPLLKGYTDAVLKQLLLKSV